jgi:hypothetical protein
MRNITRKLVLSAGVSVIALGGMAFSAQAEDTKAPAAAKKSDDSVLVVTARRKALKNAIEIKKSSDTIVDSIVADEAGQLPDTSITEVLQRVPGVTLSRFSTQSGGTPSFQIEGTGISVRGLPYNASTLNGRQVFSASGASAIQWQEVTPELGAGVDIYKASRADLIEGGTSSIDLRTRMPFDYKKPTFDMSLGASYGDQIKKTSPNMSALFTKRFDTNIGEIGFLVDGAYSKYYSEDSDAQMGPYLSENDPNRDSSPGAFDGKALVPTGYGWSQSKHDRDRYGLYVAAQWKPSDDFTYSSTFFYSQYRNKDLSHSGSWSYGPTASAENIPVHPDSQGKCPTPVSKADCVDATFDANGAMTAGSIYVGATGDTGGPVFGWGGNGWLFSALPKGDPAYEWIWGESWSPDAGHNASNTILTADCRTKYGALDSSSPNIDWGKWAQPGMFYCQSTNNSSGATGLRLGANTSAGQGNSATMDFSNSFVWTPNDHMRVKGALQYVRSINKSVSMYTGITQDDPNLSSASFDVRNDVPVLGGFDATALANTKTAYFSQMSYNGNHNNGAMLAANFDVDYNFGDDHFFKSVSFGARVTSRRERDNFEGTYWAPLAEDWVSYPSPAMQTTGKESQSRAYLAGPNAITGPYWVKDDPNTPAVEGDTFSEYVLDANGHKIADSSDGSGTGYKTQQVTKDIHVTPYGTVSSADYQLYGFPGFFAGKTPSPGTVITPSDALMQSFNWQHLASISTDATQDAVNAARCAADPNALACDSHPGHWTPQQYWDKNIDQGLGIVNSTASNKAIYLETKFGSDGFWFVPAFTGNMGLRYVVNHLTSEGNFRVNSAKDFYLNPACAGIALAISAPGGLPANLGCHLYQVPVSSEPRTLDYGYARLLPSFNLKFALPHKLTLRLAGSQNMSMPNLNDVRAGGTVSPGLIETQTANGTVDYLWTMTSNTGSNRKPVMFTSGDVSLEWYPKDGAYAYLDVFGKELRDQDLYTSYFETHDTPLIDKTTGQTVTVSLPWFYQSNLSAHKAAEIKGFELGGRTFFDFLPAPFDGFGVSGSVTYVDSRNPAILANSVVGPYIPDNSGKTNNNGPVQGNPNTDFKTMPYFGMARWSYNVELYYSKGPFSTRLAYNWHDKQLLSTNANPTSYNATGGNPYTCTSCLHNGLNGQVYEMVPLWSAAAGYLDWSADYKINDRMTMGVSAANLTKTVSKTLQEPLPGVFERLDTYMADQRINLYLRMHY